MIELVRDLIVLLERESLTVQEVVSRVGAVTEDGGAPLPMVLRSRLTGVRAAKLARYPDSGLPYTLELRLAPAAQPTVAALKVGLGEYQRAPTDMGRPREIVFRPAGAGATWRVAVVAELSASPVEIDRSKAAVITLRRDPKR